jgi:hypothetical protein
MALASPCMSDSVQLVPPEGGTGGAHATVAGASCRWGLTVDLPSLLQSMADDTNGHGPISFTAGPP